MKGRGVKTTQGEGDRHAERMDRVYSGWWEKSGRAGEMERREMCQVTEGEVRGM